MVQIGNNMKTYYFIKIDTTKQVPQDGLCTIATIATIIVGDIIDFSEEDYSNQLIKDFGTTQFIVTKRVFEIDDQWEQSGVMILYVKPIFY